jgi:uncharacterized protein with HEPN domain
MNPAERDAGYLWDMLQAARETRELTAGLTLEMLLSDLRTRRALERTLELIGEAAGRVSESARRKHTDIPWIAIIGQRNVIAHRYAAIDYHLLFTTVTRDLPGLIASLERIVDDFER